MPASAQHMGGWIVFAHETHQLRYVRVRCPGVLGRWEKKAIALRAVTQAREAAEAKARAVAKDAEVAIAAAKATAAEAKAIAAEAKAKAEAAAVAATNSRVTHFTSTMHKPSVVPNTVFDFFGTVRNVSIRLIRLDRIKKGVFHLRNFFCQDPGFPVVIQQLFFERTKSSPEKARNGANVRDGSNVTPPF